MKRDKVKSEYLDGTRSKRGKYTLMDAARVVEHKTKLMRELPEGWRYIYTKGHNEFTRVSYIECHQYQIAVYEDDFGIRHEYYEAENAQDTRRPHVNTLWGDNAQGINLYAQRLERLDKIQRQRRLYYRQSVGRTRHTPGNS